MNQARASMLYYDGVYYFRGEEKLPAQYGMSIKANLPDGGFGVPTAKSGFIVQDLNVDVVADEYGRIKVTESTRISGIALTVDGKPDEVGKDSALINQSNRVGKQTLVELSYTLTFLLTILSVLIAPSLRRRTAYGTDIIRRCAGFRRFLIRPTRGN